MKKKNTRKIYIGGNNEDSGIIANVGLIGSKASSVGLQSIAKIANDTLDKLAVTVGVNPNKNIVDVVQEISKKLNHPKIDILFDKGGEIAKKMVKTLEPAVEEIQDEINKLVSNEIEQAEKIALDAIGMIPVMGEVEEGVRLLADAVRAGEKAIHTAVNITGIGADTLNQMKKHYDEAKELLSLDNAVNHLSNKANIQLEEMAKGLTKAQKAGMRSAHRTRQSIRAFTHKKSSGYKKKRSTRKNKKMGKIGKRRPSK